MQLTHVWVVQYDGYYPAEVESIWTTKELAEARVAELEARGQDMWEVVRWPINEVLDD